MIIKSAKLFALAAFTLSLLSFFPVALAAESVIQEKTDQAESARVRSAAEMLNDLRDARLCLSQVKQQAINLFLEATRTHVLPSEAPLEQSPQSINAKMINPSRNYLPARKEWLVFYVNTLEPTIHLLKEDLRDVDANHARYPEAYSKILRPMWETWNSDVLQMNKAMDEIQSLIEPSTPSNLQLAKAALTIYDKAATLEAVRFRAAQAVRKQFSNPSKQNLADGMRKQVKKLEKKNEKKSQKK